jgi:hypothetical protein
MVGKRELQHIFESVDGVGGENRAEEQHFLHDERPHADQVGVVLLFQRFELLALRCRHRDNVRRPRVPA